MILVDPLVWYSALATRGLPGRWWCHMVSDADEGELHAFAASIGLRRSWAQLRPRASAAHYDLTAARRARAVAAGAVEVTARELVRRNFDRRVR